MPSSHTPFDFETTLRNSLPVLGRIALSLTKDPHRAKDLVQEAGTRMYLHRQSFVPGTNFMAWARVVLRNCYLSDMRRKSRRDRLDAGIPNFKSWQSPMRSLAPDRDFYLHEHLERAIADLRPIYRQPFLLFLRDMPYAKIAEIMNLPIGTVKSRIFTARQQLREVVRTINPA